MIGHTFSQTILNLIFPPRCVGCKTVGSWLCPDCCDKIPYLADPVCEHCGRPKPTASLVCRQCQRHPLEAIDGIRAVASYVDNNPLQLAIHFLKYHNHQAIAAILAQMLAEAYRRYQLSAELIVPIPLHSSRFRERGYNQSELLARQLGKLLDLPVRTDLVVRSRATESQVKLSFQARRQNVRDAFACQPGPLSERIILLVDDVCTTGSTLDACARPFKEKGVSAIWGLTLARA